MTRGEGWVQISAARRIIKCPGSAVPVRGERGTTEANEELLETWTLSGTNAHKVAQQSLYAVLKKTTKEAVENLAEELALTEEEKRAVGIYCRAVNKAYRQALKTDRNAQLLIEEPVDLKAIGIQMRGTVDAAVVSTDSISVFEFKAGYGDLIDATNDAQTKLYALALSLKGHLKDDANCTRTLIQPRRDNNDTITETVGELKKWALETVKPAVDSALSGKPDYYTEECNEKYCPHYAGCPARLRRLSEAAAQAANDIEQHGALTDATLAVVMTVGIDGKQIYAAAEKEAIRRGRELPGYERTPARIERHITDDQEAARRLKNAGYTEAQIYKPIKRELKGINELQAMTGSREQFNKIMDGVITLKPCKPHYRRIDQ